MDSRKIEASIKEILEAIGEDTNREGLIKTPYRVAKSFEHLFSGYSQNGEEILRSALFKTSNSEMVVVKDIEFYSMCEHHMLPIIGKVHIGYIPNGVVTGLSKIPRVVEVFARRLQIQENMTEQIANTIEKAISPKGVGVVVSARHMCMEMRGVEKCNSITTTSSFRGELEKWEYRNQFLSQIGG
ncbi:MAG TPA: GTP cyclohydrolase I FolE [Campylobacterales bacterium]|nr:GTP cyclohydrolase I FolE [Campylobacterales bacterium]HIO70875.1 GTP cyclohydrolase I FolE [Campylobacterales bacterium]